MAKEKSKPKKPAGQKSIKSFFKGKAKSTDNDDFDGDAVQSPNASADEAESDDDTPAKADSKVVAPDQSNLPPIHDIPAIFADLVSRIPKIKNVAQRVEGRKLRVATMCSGTESPLLALELIQKAILDQYGLDFKVEHVFSCEIEPFKQAYIERNFHPPILFRDVCELGNNEAHTAYGALVPIPGDVDLLVAGTSCVDYSNLNNVKQGLDAKGESGQTFRGMLSWVKQHRPPLVILENVCSAPWNRVQEEFEKIGYSAKYARFDTKFYYIAHTRTRVYLIAVDMKSSKVPEQWYKLVTQDLKRPASSTLDAFLLPSDDPRIHQARQKLVKENYNALDRRTGRTDWNRCERRHERARSDECLGKKRPLTNWDDGGSCSLPDYSWADWGVGQVERVWDLMDILYLRSAKKGIDPSYKTQVWNLSQNVDRTHGSKVGICPCLTPSMIPYITNRGGPMVGLEALAMQGLPIDKLLLTRETEDQLADLAGNAMSTTVVGACILAALVSGIDLLKVGSDSQSYEARRSNAMEVDDKPESMDVDSAEISDTIEDHVVGVDQLSWRPLDLAVTNARSLSDLLESAKRSARLCDCEGRTDVTARKLLRCQDCDTSTCTKCGGRPEHNPAVIDTEANPRLHPSEFADQLKSTLPMCLSFNGLSQELLDTLKSDAEVTIAPESWSAWCGSVMRISETELRFVEPKRQDIWVAGYESPHALLELHLHPQQPEWRLYGKAEDSAPANAEIRQILKAPIGRLRCDGALLAGCWELSLPQFASVPISIQGVGELVPSWEARLGLVEDQFKNKLVHSKLQVTVPPDHVGKFERDVSGVYVLLDKCGTANSALHRKEMTANESTLPPLFLLMHPQRTSDDNDCFVFSISKRRYAYGESRPIIAMLDPKWRQSSESSAKQVSCRVSIWNKTESITLQPSHGQDAQYAVPGKTVALNGSNDACGSATAVLVCSVPLRGQAGFEWPRGKWGEVDKVHERSVFRLLAWLLERIRHIDDNFKGYWQTVELPDEISNCERCSPSAPRLQWVSAGKKMVALEDPVQAGEYERSLKKRPSPFVTQLKLDDNGVGTVRVGFNAPTLLHRALSRLPVTGRTERPILSWHLNTSFTPTASLSLPKFVILSNKRDKEHAQPPHFKIPLRKEQLRSLEWMVQQEAADAPPFIEEEISEAILHPLGWRAEGRAQRPVLVRGGVLADAVGYGKTATTLGLIDCTSKAVKAEFGDIGRVDGKIAIKATLIIVPPHLTRQWESETKKFTGKHFNIITIASLSNLNPLTIEDFQNADIIIVASGLSKSQAYADNLQLFAGNGILPNSPGRHFNARLQEISESLKAQTNRLQDEGATAVMTEIKRAQAAEEKAAAEAAEARVLAKRLKGRAYREAAEKEAEKMTATLSPPPPVKSSRSPSGRQVEVVIPLLPGRKAGKDMPLSEASSSASEKPDDESDSEVPRKRKPRAATKKAIVLSDDEDEDVGEESKPSKKKGANSKARSSRKPSKAKKSRSDDDDDDYSAEETAFESEEEEDDDDEDTPLATSVAGSEDESDAPKAQKFKANGKVSGVKRKAPARKETSVKSKKSSAQSTPSRASRETSDASDTEEDKPAPKKSKKRSATQRTDTEDDDGEPRSKKKKRVDNDPWKLETTAVKKDWTQMKAPPLEMFHYSRKVVDEYTYLDGKVHSLVTNLSAERHWVLSGTPPVHDFAALKTISAFLGIHLGVDDDGEGNSVEVKKRLREKTDAEKFHSFREVHSLEWHAHRHDLGQIFLDRFVRQNVPEIDEIPFTKEVVDVTLPAAERAIYLELEHHLRALDMTIKRGRKTESDREKRLAKSLGDSKTAEEALLKRCSHFDLDTENENAMKACDVIVRERTNQLDDCEAELLKAIKAGVKREISLGNVPEESIFSIWVRSSKETGVDDADASEIIRKMLGEADVDSISKKSRKSVELTSKVKDAIWEHREATHEIRRLCKELVGRVRSLRFFTAVRDLQKEREDPMDVSCVACGREKIPIEEVSVLSSCGHMGCSECVRNCADKEECVHRQSGDCISAARALNIVKADTLGVDDEARDGRGKHYGKKLEQVMELIKKNIPKDERVLIFVQFPDLMKKVAEALKDNGIKFLEIKGSASAKSKSLESFQQDSKERVLLLNLMDESASGANLTSANHAIFLSPLLAPSQEIYDACMTQAEGRLVRFGQVKHVNIWRFRTQDTIDEEVYTQREGARPIN